MLATLCVAFLLLLTPVWTHFAIDASGGWQVTGQRASAHALSDRLVGELIAGPGTFRDLGADEAAHMRDARTIFYGFVALSAISLAFVGVVLARAPRNPLNWLAVARGGLWLAMILVGLGIFAALAFDTAFTLFHEIFFPGGNWAFPATSTLIRLYPTAFFELTGAALGVLGVAGGLGVWAIARRRIAQLATR
jgi:Protein of unknown function (DUF1461)